jgi:hypothetical protein
MRVFALFAFVMLVGCSTTPTPGYETATSTSSTALTPSATAVSRSSTCPPDGTTVPFNKVVNPAFVNDYMGCSIATTATFLTTGTYQTGLEANADYIMISASPPGEQFGRAIAVPKMRDDLVFTLKRGQLILLKGGTAQSIGGSVLPVFVATSVSRK